MSRRLPPLVALRAFEAVARLGGTRRAGDDLNVSHTVISRHLRNLEAWAGVRLIEREGRGIALTPEGRRYYEQISRGFDVIAEATEELSPGAGGEMRIACVPGLAVRWLARRLSRLEAALPGVEIILRPTDRSPDFAKGEADAEIGFNLPPARGGLASAELLRPRFFPVASPIFVSRRGPFDRPADLAAAPLIHEESREQWRIWLSQAGLDPVPPLHGPRLWHADAAIEAALQGQGVALANALLVGDDLAGGRLVEVMKTEVVLGAYSLRAPATAWDSRNLTRLRRWLADELAESVAAVERA